MLARDLICRIEAKVEQLAGRVKPAADLTELVRKGALPQAPAAAFVLPIGLRARSEGDAMANAFTQMTDDIFGVVLVVRAAGDVTGAKALPAIDELRDAVIQAVCGWGPDEEMGVFRLARGQLLAVDAGSVQYQLDFAISDQIRVIA